MLALYPEHSIKVSTPKQDNEHPHHFCMGSLWRQRICMIHMYLKEIIDDLTRQLFIPTTCHIFSDSHALITVLF